MSRKKQAVGVPVVFWHSDPVMPDETVVLAGADFSADSMVELSLVDSMADNGWTAVTPAQWSELSLKAVVPAEWPKDVYACRVRNGEHVSTPVFLNAPDVWWKQGEGGVDVTFSGSWLRLFGKCLDLEGGARLRLSNGCELKLEERGCFALRASLPADLPPGDYQLEVSNGCGGESGWRNAGRLAIKAPVTDTRPIFNVLDYGADPTGMKDCSMAFDTAIVYSHGQGGGIVFVPRGRYRLDGVMRPGIFMDSPLVLPENVSLRGEGANLTSLWWPTREKPLSSLIECRSHCSVEDLALYAQGPMHYGITGDSDVVLKNLLIRMNPYYMTHGPGASGTHHGNPVPQKTSASAICLWGANNRIIGCDILAAYCAFDIRSGQGSVISGNTIRGGSQHYLSFCAEMIYEHNVFEGSLLSGGSNIALHFGGFVSKHIYYSGNRASHQYTGDHEWLTFDGHGEAYVGHVKEVDGPCFSLVGKPQPPEGCGLRHMHGLAVYIVDGRGTGQYRFLSSYDAEWRITVDRPWEVDPDASSLIEIGTFNGRHIIISNTGEEVGALQLYPPNCECLVVGNKSVRASNINSLGAFGGTHRPAEDKATHMEVSWRNQFLDNEIVVGNAWGGGQTEADRWLGGETALQIHGFARYYDYGLNRILYQSPEWVAAALGEDKPRDINIALSRFQIVRRHIIHNNSSIRIRGVVADVVVEHCRIAHSQRGIRVDMETQVDYPKDLGMLFDFSPEPSDKNPMLPFSRPVGVLARRNHFDDVHKPYSGTALEHAKVED